LTTTTIQQNIIYGLGEGQYVADATALTNALRWANAAYRELFSRHRFRHIQKRSLFRTADGQGTYQAPSDFMGLLIVKDESNDTIVQQVTPEHFAREVSPNKITDEAFTSAFDTAVSLNNDGLVLYSETVTNTAGTTTYTRDTDYTMDYEDGEITVLSTGTMADATAYEIDYLYYTQGAPIQFCIEYDSTNKKYAFRFDPVPDATYVVSLVYPAQPSALSGSVNPMWSMLEYALERGGIFYGSMELFESQDPKIDRFERKWEQAIADMIKTDLDLVPKRNTIPVVLRRQDYTDNTGFYDVETYK